MEPTTIAIDLATRVFQIHYIEPQTGVTRSKASLTGLRVELSWKPTAVPITGLVFWHGLVTTFSSSPRNSCDRL
ncbi:hypothetical protein [Pararobbsia silviterrae]|uniref:hypothetical protein n=1 Tax=Pararobbsia silviterrae TaxID=1792498 RepID=UPI001F0C3273|nr:hypothetical protein [Pararobbsia silviterrae]